MNSKNITIEVSYEELIDIEVVDEWTLICMLWNE